MLTSADVALYKGGQMEIQNPTGHYLFRGEIETISVRESELRVRFAWLAKGEGYPSFPHRWVRHDDLDYAANLRIYEVDAHNRECLCLNSDSVGESLFLFLPEDKNRLDRSKVEDPESEPEK